MSRKFRSSGLDVRSEKSRKGSGRNESWLRHAHLPETDDARTETLFLQHQFGRGPLRISESSVGRFQRARRERALSLFDRHGNVPHEQELRSSNGAYRIK